MKQSVYKSVLYIYFFFILIVIMSLLLSLVLLFYVMRIQKPDGQKALTNWPKQYTEAFKEQIKYDEDKVSVMEEGLKGIKANQLWIQIIDEKGKEILQCNAPSDLPRQYWGTDLLKLCENGIGKTPTICLETFNHKGQEWSYLIGYPVKIAKVTMYLNGERILAGKIIILRVLLSIIGVLAISSIIYGYQLTKHITRFQKATEQIAARAYIPLENQGIFKELYHSLNQLDAEIKRSDAIKAKNNEMREEWIANITHDLKTPLSPIKGYAELMSNAEKISDDERHYARVILKNTIYIEELVNDLKLTYQLQNHMMPLRKQSGDLARFLKEQIIELLNHPSYIDAYFSFKANPTEVCYVFDPLLLKRAFQNLLVNGMIHNGCKVPIAVSIDEESPKSNQAAHKILIKIKDYGKGMTTEEADKVFERYYRVSNKNKKSEGTGLGMAIAKEIIEAHGGQISLVSQVDAGTTITITFIK